jgi:pyruvate/2-oxoglutarate dehydrogenase complex dihydrolipoamide acyltransferase (E2) component
MRGFDVEDTNATEPSEVHLTRIDVPFLELTWFFIKASLAMALAFSVTSWLWVMIGTGMIALSAGLLFLLGVPRLFVTTPVPETPAALIAPAPAAPPMPEPVVEAAPTPEPSSAAPAPAPAPTPEATPAPVVIPTGDARDPNREATEAAQREELERIRRERAQ